MKFKKGQILLVKHQRKGNFIAEAAEDFDSSKEEWYPIRATEESRVTYAASKLFRLYEADVGDTIPCRASFCTVQLLGDL